MADNKKEFRQAEYLPPTGELKVLRVIEYLLAIFMIIIVVWGLIMLAVSIPWKTMPDDFTVFHQTVEKLLSDILLLVVGLELAFLLVHRKIELLVDIVLFVVARKMLLSAFTSVEIALGVAALAGLYAVRKYLLVCPGCIPPVFSDKESNRAG